MNSRVIINNNGEAILEFSFNSNYHHLPLRSIIYIESFHRKCIVHSQSESNNETDSTYTFYEKLSELSHALSEYGFVRCHQSFLIAACFASKYYNGYVYVGGKEIAVSERYRKDIINLFDNIPTKASKKTDNITACNKHIRSTGVLICIRGEYKNSIIRLYPDIEYEIGRDGTACEIVINLPYISRRHCSLSYNDDGTYSITDHSSNGTYIIRDNDTPKKLITDNKETILPNSIVSFGDMALQYKMI